MLPNDARVKSWRGGEIPVRDLRVGDEIIGYSTEHRDVRVVKIDGIILVSEPALDVFIQHYRWAHLYASTKIWTAQGLQSVASAPSFIQSYCVVNPKRYATRTFLDVIDKGVQPGFLLSWLGDELIWSEGLLVGHSS